MNTPTTPETSANAPTKAKPKSPVWGIALLLARFIVGGMLIWVSIDKIKDPVAFLKSVKLFEIVPLQWNEALNSIAVIVPWIELLGGIILVLGLNLHLSASVLRMTRQTQPIRPGIGLRGTALVVLLMLIGFTSAIGLRTRRDMQTNGTPFMEVKFDCGCGTGIDIIWIKLLENGGLILLSMFLVFSRSYDAGRPTQAIEPIANSPPPDSSD